MAKNTDMPALDLGDERTAKTLPVEAEPQRKAKAFEPLNLGKAIRLPVPDFNDPARRPTCLEVDFPIAPINALSNLEGNAGKPIYQMSKWWARRRSSVFRSLLIAAATEAPDDRLQAAKRVWEHYYCNHQKAGSFRKLRVLDIFMGGGTTLVEGARLGMQMTGVDLNPVAWFVTKNELSCSDPEQVKALFEEIEKEVKPLVQPFYTTTCPRGHTGHWIDRESGKVADIDPAELPPEQRGQYSWDGPEIIYTFWAKHGPCQARGCGHRTPIFRTPIIAEKRLTAYFIPTACLACGHHFNIELGETRMAPGVERIVLDNEPSFVEITQSFAQLLKDYSKGDTSEKLERVGRLRQVVDAEPGLHCPKCGAFAGHKIKNVVEKHSHARRAGDIKKKDFGIESRHVYMYLLIHPNWLEGASGNVAGEELGGYAGADPGSTGLWFQRRIEGLRFVEVRGRILLADEEIIEEEGESVDRNEEAAEEEDAGSAADRKKYGLPREVILSDGTIIQTRTGTVPQQSHFTCQKCGRRQDVLESVKATEHTAPIATYALQCHCPKCNSEGYNYNGRYFKRIEPSDIRRLILAEHEWSARSAQDLANYWPSGAIQYSMRTHVKDPIPQHGYTHWWKMFNSRQLLVHSQLARAITEAPDNQWPMDVREQALGALQQYLRNQNMFVFWNPQRDTPEPFFSNANYNPKQQVIENCVFHVLGRGNWQSSSMKILDALAWVSEPWELVVTSLGGIKKKSEKVLPNDPVELGTDIYCNSSTDLSMLNGETYDLVVTDPPFGNNLYYADMADFFYVWIRLPLLRWYREMPERKFFESDRTPRAMEAVDNTVEHPDDREDYEQEQFVTADIFNAVRKLTGNEEMSERDLNPLYRREPASEFYQRTLNACWAEASRLLKPGGLMAFTFHHNEDEAWVDVLRALFDAGFGLVSTYPIRSDETKGERASFGSQKIEYDIIHVCRKRLEDPQPVSWARMRRWVKDEAAQLKELLEHSHGKELPQSDLLVILRGKALEFYSRHYGQVFTGAGEQLSVRDALLGINQLLEDLLQGDGDEGRRRPPDVAEPASRLFLRIFQRRTSMPRDELHKILRGTGITSADLEARGWIRVVGTAIHVVPITERLQFFTARGRTRKVLKTDLDQAQFLIGASLPGTGINVKDELNRRTFSVKRSVDPILQWYSEVDPDSQIREAARLAFELVSHWRTEPIRRPEDDQMALFEALELEA